MAMITRKVIRTIEQIKNEDELVSEALEILIALSKKSISLQGHENKKIKAFLIESRYKLEEMVKASKEEANNELKNRK